MHKQIFFWIVILSIFIFCGLPATGQEYLGKSPVRKPLNFSKNLDKLHIASEMSIKMPKDYDTGRFYMDGELVAFKADDGFLNSDNKMSKYIICNREGKKLKELRKVLYWAGGPLVLKLNEVGSLILANLKTKDQRLIKIEPKELSLISINPFDRTLLYTIGIQNRIYEYDIVRRRGKVKARLDNGSLMALFQLTPDEIIYIRPEYKVSYKNQYEPKAGFSIEIPIFMANIKQGKCLELAKISPSGILFYVNPDKREVSFIVEEKGTLKFISNDRIRNKLRIKIPEFSNETSEYFNGMILNYASMNPEGDLIAISKLYQEKKEQGTPQTFSFYKIDPYKYNIKSCEIIIIDMKGRQKKLTGTKNKHEVMMDWSDNGKDLLYYDQKKKSFTILELSISGDKKNKTLEIKTDNSMKVKP